MKKEYSNWKSAPLAWHKFLGSITKSVGWDIPDIGSPAHIEELQEEILIVGIPVTLTAKSFDFIVDALDLPR